MSTEEPKSPGLNIVAVGVFYFLLFVIAVWIESGQHLFKYPAVEEGNTTRFILDLLIGAVAGALISGFSFLVAKWVPSFRRLATEFQRLIGPIGYREVFFISAFSALGEEFVFRGLIQGKWGIIAGSLTFGILHVGPNRKFLPWTFFAIVVGFILGLFYEWRDNILTPTAMHFVINFINLKLLSDWARKARSESP